MIYYITGNQDKVTSANLILQKYNLSLTPKEISMTEIQSDSLEEIALDKANQAFAVIKEPYVISDTGWYIPALKGFPGAYMHYVNEWFTPQDYLNLIKPYKDRTVVMKQVVCYRDRDQAKTFFFERKGIILEEPQGKGRSGDMVFSFRDDKKSIAECRNASTHYTQDDQSVWSDFARWYVSFKTPNL